MNMPAPLLEDEEMILQYLGTKTPFTSLKRTGARGTPLAIRLPTTRTIGVPRRPMTDRVL
jgi:hypothetical protein